MKFNRYIALLPLALLAACRASGPEAVHSGEAIALTAGLAREGVVTKADAFLPLTPGTKVTLKAVGEWQDHLPNHLIEIPTTATVETGQTLSLDPVLYWDDFGTADPVNGMGRTQGLTIYGVAVDGLTTAPYVNDYTTLLWELPEDQEAGWADKDLLISYNVQEGPQYDGTYKFDDRAAGKRLVFRHALSKITVNLTAGEGFAGGEFEGSPTAKLVGTWAFRTTTLDVTTGVFNGQGGASDIMLHSASKTVKDGLVIPGSPFFNDYDNILRINADGNVYYVTAKEIRAAIGSDPYVTEPGKNYIFNVTLDKTGVKVSATVVDWVDVESAEVKPVIDVTVSYGSEAGATHPDSFVFYRSLAYYGGYSPDSQVQYTAGEWTMAPQLYWPDHNTHYQFRGVLPAATVKTSTHGGDDYQVIALANAKYKAGTFPSDLQIARPEVAEDAVCSNHEKDHPVTNLYRGGICATEGTIRLSFRYIMSQVEVNLSTTSDEDQVNLTGAEVDITPVYTHGEVKLGDREIFLTESPETYRMDGADADENKRLSAVVPQDLAGVQFRITIHNDNGTSDYYFADIAPIKKTGSDELVAPAGAWESGVHYVYNLKLSKTKVRVSGTLADWTTVTADENVTF